MTKGQNKKPNPYYSGRAAAARTGLTRVELLKMAAAGRVKALALPGSAIKFSSADVDRLAEEMNATDSK